MNSHNKHEISWEASGNTVKIRKTRRILGYVKKPVAAAFAVTFSDLAGLLLVFGTLPRTTLALVMLLEGGFGLLAGAGIALSSTPSISKIGEITIGSARWSREGERNAERVAGKWIVASSLIIMLGVALSLG